MQNLAKTFLTKAEQHEVTMVVHEVERTTSGEIVPLIVARSHEYPMASAICSVALSLPISLLLTNIVGSSIWVGAQNIWLFLLFLALSLIALFPLVSRLNWLQYYFLNPREVEREVQEGALAAFYAHGLYKTAQQNGILLYISVLEKKVWILADGGINDKIDKSTWELVIKNLTSGIKGGQRCQAICAAIRKTGEILHTHFPYQKADTDELHNLIII